MLVLLPSCAERTSANAGPPVRPRLIQRYKMTQQKPFRAFWSQSTFRIPQNEDLVADVCLDYFSEDQGYDAQQREQIASLRVGQFWTSPEYGQAHQVRRIA